MIRARWWTPLLVLAAVFAVHGLDCAAAHHGPAPALHPAAHEVLHTPSVLLAPFAATAADVAGHAMVAADRPAEAGGAGGLWTACLGILAGAAAVLALRRRGPALRRHAIHPAADAGALPAARGSPLPAPLQSSLCVLRM